MQQWRIVFIDEDGNLLSGLLIRPHDYCIKAVSKFGSCLRCNAIFLLLICRKCCRDKSAKFPVLRLHDSYQSDDRSLHPFRLHLHNLQPLESSFLPMK